MRTWLFAATVAVLAMTGPAVRDAAGQSPMPAEAEHGFAPSLAAVYITDVQQQLTARGYYAGLVDGRMTPALRTAISVYQSDVAMRVTGIPDLAVVNMLRFGPDVKATIQPLGSQLAAVVPSEPRRQPVPPVQARPSGVPPYEAPEPYRHPTAAVDVTDEPSPSCPPAVKPLRGETKGALKAEEPPLPKAAPQHRVVASPLPAG